MRRVWRGVEGVEGCRGVQRVVEGCGKGNEEGRIGCTLACTAAVQASRIFWPILKPKKNCAWGVRRVWRVGKE